MMSLEFIGRLQKELSLTGSAVYESVVAVAERVNRKVHILRLHSHAAQLLSQIESAHGELGHRIADVVSDKVSAGRSSLSIAPDELQRTLDQSVGRVRDLKQALHQVDGQIRELKMETIHEDLLTLQRDLSVHSAALERMLVVRRAPAIGKHPVDLTLPASVRLITVFRGPFLIPPSDSLVFQPDDVVVIMGARSDLDQVAALFGTPRKVKPVYRED
ncbi:MAG TPA: TrkA C-terminal domain-containing protein [Nitrospira sp.]|nr:TrkA C-terminal domain-containing protein [Nitrospira sp.]